MERDNETVTYDRETGDFSTDDRDTKPAKKKPAKTWALSALQILERREKLDLLLKSAGDRRRVIETTEDELKKVKSAIKESPLGQQAAELAESAKLEWEILDAEWKQVDTLRTEIGTGRTEVPQDDLPGVDTTKKKSKKAAAERTDPLPFVDEPLAAPPADVLPPEPVATQTDRVVEMLREQGDFRPDLPLETDDRPIPELPAGEPRALARVIDAEYVDDEAPALSSGSPVPLALPAPTSSETIDAAILEALVGYVGGRARITIVEAVWEAGVAVAQHTIEDRVEALVGSKRIVALTPSKHPTGATLYRLATPSDGQAPPRALPAGKGGAGKGKGNKAARKAEKARARAAAEPQPTEAAEEVVSEPPLATLKTSSPDERPLSEREQRALDLVREAGSDGVSTLRIGELLDLAEAHADSVVFVLVSRGLARTDRVRLVDGGRFVTNVWATTATDAPTAPADAAPVAPEAAETTTATEPQIDWQEARERLFSAMSMRATYFTVDALASRIEHVIERAPEVVRHYLDLLDIAGAIVARDQAGNVYDLGLRIDTQRTEADMLECVLVYLAEMLDEFPAITSPALAKMVGMPDGMIAELVARAIEQKRVTVEFRADGDLLSARKKSAPKAGKAAE